jgi:predicted ATPase with chaperone activity
MLAQRFAGLLPPMTVDEALESAAVLSLAGRFALERWGQRPTAAPHHTASAVALVGGGCQFHHFLRHCYNSCDRRPYRGVASLVTYGVA